MVDTLTGQDTNYLIFQKDKSELISSDYISKFAMNDDTYYTFHRNVKEFMIDALSVIESSPKNFAVIKVNSKGGRFFDDLMQEWLPKTVLCINSYEVEKYSLQIQDKVVFIFDDSINTGKTINNVLITIKKSHPSSVVVICLLANSDSYEKLKQNDYIGCSVHFKPYKVSNKFLDDFLQLFPPALCSHCKPYEGSRNDTFSCSQILSKENVKEILLVSGIETIELPMDEKKLDRFQLVWDFYKIDGKSECRESNHKINFEGINFSQLKVRFFIHLSKYTTTFYISYIIEIDEAQQCIPQCINKFDCIHVDCPTIYNNSENCLTCMILNISFSLREIISKCFDSYVITPKYEFGDWWVFKNKVDIGKFKKNDKKFA